MSKNEISNGNIIVLVGAGASMSIGIPTMKKMVGKYRAQIEEGSLAAQGLEILDRAKVDSDLEETLYEINRIQETPNSGAFRALVHTKGGSAKIQHSDQEIAHIKKATQTLANDILEWMADTCLGFDRTKAEHNWGELVEVLNKEGIPIFTTNYDFAIEEIAENHGIDIIDNFKTGRLNRKFWDHSLTSFNNKGLLIVKLHGSVDWYTTKDRKDIEKLEQRVLKNRDGKRVDRVAIFPTRFKDIYESYFFSLYLKLISMLDTSHTVIVIGHSLRDEYIRAALRECFRKPTFNLIYLGPSYPKELSDLEVAGKDPKLQTIFISEKFENYANTLAYVIRKYNKNEVSQVLREITDFGKKSRITFSTKITWVKVGQEIEGIIKVLAPAIPPAILKAKLVQKSETSDEEVYIEVLDKKGGNQTIIEGIAEKEFNIWFTIPSEIAKGDYSFWFELHNEKGVIIADKDYICKVAGTKDNEEESITKEQQESINLLDEEVISHDNPDPIMDQEGEIN